MRRSCAGGNPDGQNSGSRRRNTSPGSRSGCPGLDADKRQRSASLQIEAVTSAPAMNSFAITMSSYSAAFRYAACMLWAPVTLVRRCRALARRLHDQRQPEFIRHRLKFEPASSITKPRSRNTGGDPDQLVCAILSLPGCSPSRRLPVYGMPISFERS